MRENNRKPIEKCRKKLPQFTTMNVIDGQAGLVFYSSLIFYSLTIDNILNIVVLLILAAVSISMLTGENGIITQAQKSREETEQSKCEELVTLAINGLITENAGDKSKITPQDIAEEVNRMENRTDVTAEGNAFPTNILFTKEDRKVGVSIEIGVTDPIKQEIYDEPGLEEEAEKNADLFLYEPIEGTGEIGATDWDSLPTKEARITGMNPKYCNSIYGGYTSDTGEEYENTNYDIILDNGTKLTDTLVVPYQVEIDGELYKITEADISAEGISGYSLPNVKTVIYPNTIRKISSKVDTGSVDDNDINIIENIILSRNLKEIGSEAFYNCTKLTNITIPSSVTSIGYAAFSGCTSLTSVIISEGVTSIGDLAFSDCTSLANITIPNSVTSIGYAAFSGCTSLTNITIPNGVTSIGSSAFSDCTSLANITIPNSVTSIESSVFSGCTSLTSITIPSSVTSIGSAAFSGCTSLTNITIPNSVTSIGSSAFSDTLWFNSLPDGEIYLGKVFFCYKGTMPENTNIKIKEGTIRIEEIAFSNCGNLINIEIPESVTSIGDSAFSRCSGLTSITISEGVTNIGGSAFSGCTSVANITIPESVTSIGEGAFYRWTGNQTINCKATEKPAGWHRYWDAYLYMTPRRAKLNWGVK